MSDWKRTTKEVPFEGLPAAMVSAMNKHIEQYNLGPILSDALICIQTDSEKGKQGLFGEEEIVQMGAVVTPRWLVWCTSGTDRKLEVDVLSAQLINITVQDYAQTPFAKMVPDSGVQVSGMFTDVSENASAFLGADEGPAGIKFREILVEAAQDAKK